MFLKTILEQINISEYQLSKTTDIPKSTINDTCTGKSTLKRCNVITVYKIAKALDYTIEQLLSLDNPKDYDVTTGLPIDKSYLECGLPEYLQKSLDKMKNTWEILASGKPYYR